MSEPHDNISSDDSVQIEIKGPDPEVWGTDEERAQRNADAGIFGGANFPGVNEIWNEGTPEEIKGPGSEWAS